MSINDFLCQLFITIIYEQKEKDRNKKYEHALTYRNNSFINQKPKSKSNTIIIIIIAIK